MKKEIKEFYKHDIEYNKFFEKKKKISFDTNDKLLEIIDKLVKLTSNSRTVILNALIGSGMAPFFKTLENTWKTSLKEYKGNKKEDYEKNIKKLLEDLEKLKKEYNIPD